jgi:hypothetical protein
VSFSATIANPLVITASKSNQAGYSHTFCVKCSNGVQTENVENFKISQTLDCSLTLSTPTSSPTFIELVYTAGASDVAVTPTPSFTTWDDLFQN